MTALAPASLSVPSSLKSRPLGREFNARRTVLRTGMGVVKVTAASKIAAPKLARTWSNPNGEILTEVVPQQLWVAQRPFVWNGIDVGGKMAVVKLTDGTLWVHSPVHLDGDLRAELAALGEVKHVVSPNFEHVKYASEWIQEFPSAHAYACPGLREKKPDIRFSADICDDNNETPAQWPAEIDVSFFDCERNPFTKQPFFNEVVFFHAPSGSLIVTDLWWNWPSKKVPRQTWLWKQGMDLVFLPFYRNLMVPANQKAAFHAAVDRVLTWPFRRIVPCHGVVTPDAPDQSERSHALFRNHLLEGIPSSGSLPDNYHP
mmetsp:Transcript_40776/g.68314  ORF Transcript_40776/g.68314 Transcript_40776/m.68314 type:complete len:316 (+) Transcript_40776:314-1261(+)|eukprot:CAMPEP_0198224196 /NCGR_PEP_ID=MMETSP1445-20131203/95765_1 /TAXON_ID=36898 /ORGANISM="Pyramimonas sp., Strain CCMP2087" /LENGTH=315 /DNA_ID=CAMNT_0043903275 /DNA_START=291 /DNA_END=1238 /DNA_ORIENTATION=+